MPCTVAANKTVLNVQLVFDDMLTLSPPIPLRLYTFPYWSNPPFIIFDIRALWRSGLSARMSEIKNGGLDQYSIGPFEWQKYGTAGVEGVKQSSDCAWTIDTNKITTHDTAGQVFPASHLPGLLNVQKCHDKHNKQASHGLWGSAGLKMRAILTHNVRHIDIRFSVRSWFISRSVHARLQVSVCSSYNLFHPG